MSIVLCKKHGKQPSINISNGINNALVTNIKSKAPVILCLSYEIFVPSLAYSNFWYLKEESESLSLPECSTIVYDGGLRKLAYDDIDDESEEDGVDPFPFVAKTFLPVCFKCYKDIFKIEHENALNDLENRIEIKKN